MKANIESVECKTDIAGTGGGDQSERHVTTPGTALVAPGSGPGTGAHNRQQDVNYHSCGALQPRVIWRRYNMGNCDCY